MPTTLRQTLKKNIPKLLNATKGVNGKNRKALEQLDERYKAFWLEYLAKEKLLDEMADTTFSIAKYLKAKQESLLDAMDTINPEANRKERKRKRQARARPTTTLCSCRSASTTNLWIR